MPPFFAHEGDILRRLQGGPVPRLLGHDRDRILLADIAGSDRYDAGTGELLEMVSLLVDLQAAWIGRTDQLRSIDLPDWRGPGLTAGIADVVERQGATLPADVLAGLDAFVAGLPARFDAIAACGLPDTIVHGDFHPGNVRGGGDLRGDDGAGAGNHALTLLDWGDCGIGNPLLDLSAFLDRVPAEARATVRDHWLDAWRRHRPGLGSGRGGAARRPGCRRPPGADLPALPRSHRARGAPLPRSRRAGLAGQDRGAGRRNGPGRRRVTTRGGRRPRADDPRPVTSAPGDSRRPVATARRLTTRTRRRPRTTAVRPASG